eukprot:5404818-Pyramimonas_sp.AAC.1
MPEQCGHDDQRYAPCSASAAPVHPQGRDPLFRRGPVGQCRGPGAHEDPLGRGIGDEAALAEARRRSDGGGGCRSA